MQSCQSSAGVGWSRLPESAKAGREAVRMALDTAGRQKPVAAIVYMTVLYDPAVVLSAIRDELGPDVPIVGSSTQGISRNDAVIETDRVLGVALICSSRAKATTAVGKKLCADPFAAGRSLAEQLGDPRTLGEVPLLLWCDPR